MANIVIIDDSVGFRETVEDIIADAGHNVIGTADEMKTGLDILSRVSPDVVLLDFMMPGKSGLDFIQRIRRDYPSLKIILVTALKNDEVNNQAEKLGVKAIVFKPFNAPGLLKMIDKVMAG